MQDFPEISTERGMKIGYPTPEMSSLGCKMGTGRTQNFGKKSMAHPRPPSKKDIRNLMCFLRCCRERAPGNGRPFLSVQADLDGDSVF
jgi:hypothetical protein